MDEETMERIRQAANEASDRVWDGSVIPGNVHSGGLQEAMSGVENEAEAVYQNTVRQLCAELGFEECDYYLANPDAAVIHEPACMDEPLDHASEADEDRLLDDHLRDNDDFGHGLGY